MMSERTEKLRLHAQNGNYPFRSAESEYFYMKGYSENRVGNEVLRQGLAKRYELSHCTPIIDENELIVGKPNPRALSEDEIADFNRLRADFGAARCLYGGQESHMAIDYEKLLTLGINGIIAQIENYRAALDISEPEQLKREFFYRACIESLNGLAELSEKYSKYAAELAERETDEKRRSELLEISEITAYVPKNPPRTFREAVQSVSFVTSQLEGLYQLGRPDRYLIKYYRADIEAGRITRDEALELCACLSIMMNEYMPKGLAVGFMICGRDANGKDVTNELSYLFIESIALTRLAYPGVGVCIDSDTPRDILRLSCQMLGKGYSHPAIFNDEVITKGLMGYGLPFEHACEYIHSTCVEITPVKRSAVWVASPYHNLTGYLLEEMAQPDADTRYPDFDSLLAGYRIILAEHIRREVIAQNTEMIQRMAVYSNPLVSCFVYDCLERGCDIEQGGALYNWIMPSFVGIANLTDSLFAIKKLVYENKELTLSQYYDILKSDFVGYEELRAKIERNFEKYGNDSDEVDSIVPLINSYILEEVAKYKNPKGDRFIPSLFCWIMHESFGHGTMATPDGRLAGFPFGDGSGPAQGRDKTGPTCAILSSTKWEHSPFIGGIALNMRFSKSMFGEESIEKLI